MTFPILRKIKSELLELDQIPLFGNAPPFPWERFSSLLTSRFGLSSIDVKASKGVWCEASELSLSGQLTLAFSLHPLQGSIFWVLSHKDLSRLTSWMLTGKSKSRSVTAELLQEGFYRYLVLEALDCLQTLPPLNSLTLQMNETAPTFEEPVFCLDVEIRFEEKSCWGKLLIPSSLRKAWVSHFSKSQEEYISPHTARVTELALSLQVGSVVLTQKQFGSLEPGDFVLLDQSKMMQATLGRTPLFKVKTTPTQVELIDYAFYPEATMKNSAEEEVKSLKELPLTVVAEVARIQISLEKLMQLQPGNTLDLTTPIGQNISLTVNGQCVGKAELVELGEMLGLRILEIG